MKSSRRKHRPTDGFTLIELTVAMTVFAVIMTIALSFLQVQTKGLRIGMDHMSVLQTLRYSLGILEQDVQTGGTNVAPRQPEIVYAGANLIAFNSDYVTSRPNDPFAVFYDPDVERASSYSLPRERSITLPGTSFTYPDSTYSGGLGGRSPAETLIFFFSPDTATTRDDDYVLYRQVNDAAPQVVTKDLLATPGVPFFRYFKENDAVVDSIHDGALPIFHSMAIHGSAADTGVVALVDSIRAVRVTLTATNGKTGDQERTALLTRIILLPNVGFGTLETCGSAPLLRSGISAVAASVDGAPVVNLSWTRSTDEGGGENDVVRYVIYRRLAGESSWNEPYLSIPSGQSDYTYVDGDVVPGESYTYALAAQDCTPTLSSMSNPTTVSVPN
jgi:prepilin-type N-terminal cleavage/methylation domain-containing protein